MKDYTNKHVWIIGASSGIGKALAHELSARGATLTLSARSKDKLTQLNDDLGGKHFVCDVDVSKLSSVEKCLACVQSGHHRIDSIINLAALYNPGSLNDLDIEETQKLIDVNLMGMFNLIHVALPVLQQQGSGQIALCGSVAGYKGLPNGQPYSASKAAVINLAESLKAENMNLDVKVINPGFVRTPLTDKNDFDMPMMIEPEDAANYIADGLLKKRFDINFPKKFTLLVKALQFIPAPLFFNITRKMA